MLRQRRKARAQDRAAERRREVELGTRGNKESSREKNDRDNGKDRNDKDRDSSKEKTNKDREKMNSSREPRRDGSFLLFTGIKC